MSAGQRGTVAEYIAALQASGKFGPQVMALRQRPGKRATTVSPTLLAPELQQLLADRGITALYTHQQEAIAAILAGTNTVVATPTASGKSLIYNLPVLQGVLQDPEAKALYLFPLKALAQDQLKTLHTLWQQLPDQIRPPGPAAAIYDGDTTAHHRKKIRDNLPPVLITNPDMLHLSMLPYHDRWAQFWSRLRHVVIDEVHTYRGVFGSHVAWVLRRLKRICALYGAEPTFILASATIGNPDEHSQILLDAPVQAITKSGAGSAARHILLLNPLESAATAATQLLEAAISRELRTIVYCQSRKLTELITIWTEQRLKDRTHLVASYRSGFLPEDRREIETNLASGRLLGVISTSALELGIDIGNLDICLLVGYPGSIMATWQRAGRTGRGGQESLVVLIGNEDALDQHFMRHPEDFFQRAVEPVTINPANPYIAEAHLVCAAAEQPLTVDEPLLKTEGMMAAVQRLSAEARLLQSADGRTWFSHRTYPQRQVNLRGGGATLTILTQPERAVLGFIDAGRAPRDCHPGAIYLHHARTYHVDSLDLEGREVVVSEVRPNYYTRVLSEKETEILEIVDSRRIGPTEAHFGMIRVTERIVAYHRIAQGSQRILKRVPLDLPPQIFTTQGFWLLIPTALQQQITAAGLHFMGGIHALEHAVIGLMPLHVLCDRNDLGGISHPWHDQVGAPAVFVYDGHAGGMGLTAKAFAHLPRLLVQTRQAVDDCPCELGCPSCVHSPKCGSGNRPIDKQACQRLLDLLLRPSTPDIRVGRLRPAGIALTPIAPVAKRAATSALPANYGVFDLETQKSAQEVGGWHRAALMRVSVAVLYESAQDRFLQFTEATIDQLIERLFTLDLVVGFNNKRFDNAVLSAYTKQDLGILPSLDLLEVIGNRLGYRLSLDRLAEKTLRVRKQGNGLAALEWYKQGEMEKLRLYCQKDVEITRDLLLYGLRQQHLLFQNKAGQEVRLPVDFDRAIEEVMARQSEVLRARRGFSAPSRKQRDGSP